jgi:hypothetical protein
VSYKKVERWFTDVRVISKLCFDRRWKLRVIVVIVKIQNPLECVHLVSNPINNLKSKIGNSLGLEGRHSSTQAESL